ncbi:MAG TPA: 2-phosphosulfolactate phosphatase [Gemmatimonadaceae bacterium]|nr:2-phosphosulfolactate phosphatase [Gemmatimonadaceae bacterium]
MRIDVVFGATSLTPALVSGRVVAVIDVLRASTSIAAALANGARTIIPLDSIDEVITRAKAFDRSEVRLAGERKMLPISGFDLGNSPSEFSREVVEGKTVLLTTTNGTSALVSVQGARDAVVAAYVNFSAVLALLGTALRGGADVTLLCAGRDRQLALEDAACAGRYALQLRARAEEAEMSDGAAACALIATQYEGRLEEMLEASEHGRALRDAGFQRDLADCAAIDAYPVVPIYQDRQITRLGPDRER